MNRRQFLGAAAAGIASAQQKPADETVTANATQDVTPRVAIVLSSFKGSQDHDGTEIKALPEPRPVDAEIASAHLDAMLRKVLEIGDKRAGGLDKIIEADDWVVIKPNIVSCYGLEPKGGGHFGAYVPGSVTDLRIVRSLIAWLVEHKRGARITIAEGAGGWMTADRSGASTDGWSTDWGGAFEGLSYKGMVADLARKYPQVQIDFADLNFEDCVEKTVIGTSRTYFVPKTIQQCDRLISLSPLKTNPATGVSLALKNYFGIAPGAKYGFPKLGLHKLGDVNDTLLDLYSFRPADYAIVGGSWGVEGAQSSVRHNVLIGGPSAVAVDAVGAAVMGFDPAKLKFLKSARDRGFGIFDVESIWTRGNEVEEARRKFKPAEVL